MNLNLTTSAASDKVYDSYMTASSAQGVAVPAPSAIARKNGMRFEGHRGAGLLEPENTLKAFQRAIDLGIDGVELDVWVSKDGVPIVVHGTDEGIVHFKDNTDIIYAFDLTAKELKNWILPNGETIPTLEEVLVLCKDKIQVNIELKEETYRVVKPTLELISKLDMFNQVCFSSFVHKHKNNVEEARRQLGIDNSIEFGFLVWTLQCFDFYLEAAHAGDTLNIDIDLLLQHEDFILEHIEKAKAKDMRIKFYFGFHAEESHDVYRRLEDLKVDALIINQLTKSTDFAARELF